MHATNREFHQFRFMAAVLGLLFFQTACRVDGTSSFSLSDVLLRPSLISAATPTPTTTPGPVSSNGADITEPSTYSPPIVIDHGGTYTGNWKSMRMDTPAVTVSTSEPVIIQNCHIAGNAIGIFSPWSKANLTVRNCSFHGKAPDVNDRARDARSVSPCSKIWWLRITFLKIPQASLLPIFTPEMEH